MGFTTYYCVNGDKKQIEYEEHYSYYENWVSRFNSPGVVGYIDVDKESHEAWLDLGERYYGVLVSVSVCDSSGSIYRDLGYLYDKDHITDYGEARRIYNNLNLTIPQKQELQLYLSKWIEEDEGLYLSYEIIDNDGYVEASDLESLNFMM